MITRDELPRSGSWSAWLGGYDDADDQLYQTITVPSWARSARLQFYLYVRSDDQNWPYDFFRAEFQTASGSTLQQLSSADNTWESTDWYKITQSWADFSAHAGTQRRLWFQGTNDGSYSTDFFIDDVSFVVYPGTLGQDAGQEDGPQIKIISGDESIPQREAESGH